ncbi:hypothetical protein [Asaia lannensis]|uniref:hypothetical protein n=1 Tax=Asaia lannensis TaxID=415421 RepID=UPI003873BEBD
MTFLIAAAVFCVWAYFWVRGALWAALIVPGFWAWFLGVAAMEHCQQCTIRNLTPNPAGLLLLVVGTIALSFAPLFIHRRRASRMDRALNGLRLRDWD